MLLSKWREWMLLQAQCTCFEWRNRQRFGDSMLFTFRFLSFFYFIPNQIINYFLTVIFNYIRKMCFYCAQKCYFHYPRRFRIFENASRYPVYRYKIWNYIGKWMQGSRRTSWVSVVRIMGWIQRISCMFVFPYGSKSLLQSKSHSKAHKLGTIFCNMYNCR